MLQKKAKVYFRADGNAKIGLGHIFRSLALAEMLAQDFDCHFIIKSPLENIKKELFKYSVAVTTLNDSISNINEANILATDLQKDSILVLDGYHFDTAYQRAFKEKKHKIVCIDDIHAYPFLADAIINHAGGVTEQYYKALPTTQFYLGLAYALLRKPFREAAKNKKVEKKDNIFICLGGADPNNDTLRVLETMASIGEKSVIHLVLGGAYLHEATLQKFISKNHLTIKVYQQLSAEKMVHLMNKCARAITPPSTISYEYLSTGGTLYLKKIAENQNDIYNYFTVQKFALDFETHYPKGEVLTLKEQETYSSILDGQQEKRFITLFYDLASTIRKANEEDCLRYFEWANDPLTRQYSYQSEPISLAQHEQWFYEKINNSNAFLYVLALNKQAIGQIRFDLKNKKAIISFSIDKDYRGKRLGMLTLKKGIEVFKKEMPNIPIIGFVKKENKASSKAFRALNFKEENATLIENSYQYTL